MTETLPANSALTSAVRFGGFPTPLERLLTGADREGGIWLKDDGCTAPLYGGNKVRKLERLLTLARRQGAKRLLTVGAAGSHHVLATCLYGRRLGLPTHAVLTSQPWTAHAEGTLRAALNAGLTAAPANSALSAVQELHRARQRGDFVIGPGGAGGEGTWAYRLAVEELKTQLAEGGVTGLHAIVVAAGSGSTAAGLLAGILLSGAATRIIAVQVGPNPALRSLIIGQAVYSARQHGEPISALRAARALSIERRFMGRGYGHATQDGEQATLLARSFGLGLDPTYTAKAFAATLRWAGLARASSERDKLRLQARQSYLYWHTLSSVPLTPLLEGAAETLPNELAQLLRKP